MRTDVAFLETEDGVYVQGDGDAFVIQGAGAYRYLSALLPHLDGSTTLSDLVAGLPAAHAATVRSLITSLASRGVITDAPERGAVLDASARSRFGGQLALLEQYGDDGTGFARAARARVLVVCEDPAPATALADALTANGVGSAPPGAVLTGTAADADAVAGSDLICLIAAGRPSPVLFDLAERARAAGTAFVSLLRIGELLVLGPWQHGDRGSASVHSLLLRLSDNGIAGAQDVWQAIGAGGEAAAAAPELPGAAVSMAVAVAGFEVFKVLTGRIGGDTDGAVVIVDPDRFTVRTERLIPHPAAPRDSPEPGAPADPVKTTDPDERAYRRFQPVIADTVGIARRFDDDGVAQLPLRTSVLIAPSADPAPIVSSGIESTLETRLAALEHASLRYAMNIQRRCAGLLSRPEPGAEVVAAERMQSRLGAAPRPGGPLVAARSLGGGSAPVALPRGAVLAGPWDRRAARFEPDLTGVAAGSTPAVALSRALLGAAGAYVVAAVAREEIQVGPVEDPPEAASGGGSGGRLAMLAATLRQDGCAIGLYLAQGVVPVAVVHADDGSSQRIIARPGRSWAEAAASALTAVAGARRAAGSTGGPAAPVLDGFSVSARPADVSLLGPAVEDEALIARLGAAGMRAAAVDLTPPDLAGVTNVVRVLLFRDTATAG